LGKDERPPDDLPLYGSAAGTVGTASDKGHIFSPQQDYFQVGIVTIDEKVAGRKAADRT
jgi:hypothetical protein